MAGSDVIDLTEDNVIDLPAHPGDFIVLFSFNNVSLLGEQSKHQKISGEGNSQGAQSSAREDAQVIIT